MCVGAHEPKKEKEEGQRENFATASSFPFAPSLSSISLSSKALTTSWLCTLLALSSRLSLSLSTTANPFTHSPQHLPSVTQ